MSNMSLYSNTRERLRRLTGFPRASRTIQNRTYVFIFVPLDSRRNDRVARASVVNEEVHEQELNYDLMWTWFLPNPLWPPKERK